MDNELGNNVKYIVHGFKNQNDSKIKLTAVLSKFRFKVGII